MNKRCLFLAVLVSLAFGLTLTACGPSKRTLAIQSVTSIDEVKGLRDKLTWIEGNVQSGGDYTINLTRDEVIDETGLGEMPSLSEAAYVAGKGNLSYKNVNNVTITIRGVGGNRTISRKNEDAVFRVDSGVTLILENVTIRGTRPSGIGEPKGNALVVIIPGGTLVLNEGSVITGEADSKDLVTPGMREIVNFGGGVFVSGTLIMNEGSSIIFNRHTGWLITNGGGVNLTGGGTFLMKGGTIAGNVCSPHPGEVQRNKNSSDMKKAITHRLGGEGATMDDMDEKEVVCNGGGVYVGGSSKGLGPLKASPSATFVKTGGTITGYASDAKIGNQTTNISRNPIAGHGHAIYFDLPGGNGKAFDADIGPDITLEFKDDVLKEGRAEETSAPVAPTAEPVAEAAGEQPAVPQAAPAAPQKEYDAEMLRIKIKSQELAKEYQKSVQKNPAGHKEATEKYQKDFQEVQQEALEAKRKYQEAMQKQ